MKKALIISLLVASNVNGQSKINWSKFVNITELGFLMGRVRYNTDSWNPNPTQTEILRRVTPTIQMFNGLQVLPKTAIGLTVSLDPYENTILMPIGLGVRQTLVANSSKKAQLIGSLDVGYGTTLAQLDNNSNETTGGLMANPMLGYRLPNRGGSAWVIMIGYKTQNASIKKNINLEDFEVVEKRTYNRLAFRVGFQF